METLNWLSWTIASFVFVLGIMIFVHELGHYLMAKYLRIGVEVFSLGFGPRLFGFRKGDTDYRVSLLPLGGFVKMSGETYDEELTGSQDEFLSRPKTHRFAVAVAGPLMNLGLAVVLVAANFISGVEIDARLSQPPVVGYVGEGSEAEQAGLQPGDEILAVDSNPTPTWQELTFAVAVNPNRSVPVRFRRNDQVMERQIRISEAERSGEGQLQVYPEISNRIVSVFEEQPAAESGLLAGDVIREVSSGDEKASYRPLIQELISDSEGRPLTFTIERTGTLHQVEIVPRMTESGRPMVGIEFEAQPVEIQRYGVVEAFQRSFAWNYMFTKLTFQIVRRLLTGQASLEMMSGPIEIARVSGQAAAQGSTQLVGLMALISLQLGIFNLFPIPILDGGVIALLAVEGLIGRDLSLKVKERIVQAGFIFLILLMSIVIYNDIAKNI